MRLCHGCALIDIRPPRQVEGKHSPAPRYKWERGRIGAPCVPDTSDCPPCFERETGGRFWPRAVFRH